MIRSFLPIGQGGFAAEQFRNGENIVFDCGTISATEKTNSIKYLQRLIQRTFKPRDIIRKVFVSHLHDDHINGLPFLLRYCQVDEVYLPYLTPSEQAITIMLLHETMDSENLRLVQALITGRSLGQFGIETRVVYVRPQERFNDDGFIEFDNERFNEQFLRTVASGIPIRFSLQAYGSSHSIDDEYTEWEFIPFSFDGSVRSKQFRKLLKESGITENDLREIRTSSFWEKSGLFTKMSQLYSQIRTNVNLSTMVVYSGAKEDCWRQFPTGCLYTGDYRAKSDKEWGELRAAYDSVWKRIGVFTIPHHGSSDYYNPMFSKQNARFIINAGYENQYGHPGHSVLCDLIENECQFYWVNEHIGSQMHFGYKKA